MLRFLSFLSTVALIGGSLFGLDVGTPIQAHSDHTVGLEADERHTGADTGEADTAGTEQPGAEGTGAEGSDADAAGADSSGSEGADGAGAGADSSSGADAQGADNGDADSAGSDADGSDAEGSSAAGSGPANANADGTGTATSDTATEGIDEPDATDSDAVDSDGDNSDTAGADAEDTGAENPAEKKKKKDAAETAAPKKAAAAKAATAPKTLKSSQPAASGAWKIGTPLTAKTGGWTSGTKFSYQWLLNGKVIKGATKQTYTLQPVDQCHAITVRVKGALKGYTSVTRVSKTSGNTDCPTAKGNIIYAGQRMQANSSAIVAKGGRHSVNVEKDGNAYLYNHGRGRYAMVGKSGAKLVLQSNGNLVLRNGATVYWTSGTANRGVTYGMVRENGTFTLNKRDGTLVWSSSMGTSGRSYRWNNWGTVRYSQNDLRWSHTWFGSWRFGPTGCVPTAFAALAQGYGIKTNPYAVGQIMNWSGDFNHGKAGAGGQSIVAAARAYGLEATPLYSEGTVAKALRENRQVIALVAGPSGITSPGSTHAVVLNQHFGGATYVMNPWTGSQQTWSLSTLWAWQSWDSLDRNAGAVFWAIG